MGLSCTLYVATVSQSDLHCVCGICFQKASMATEKMLNSLVASKIGLQTKRGHLDGCYLGRIINVQGGTDADGKARLGEEIYTRRTSGTQNTQPTHQDQNLEHQL